MFSCDFTITGIEGTEEILPEIENKLKRPINQALNYVGSEMIANLQEHIKEDWYEPWGEPLVYKRRTDDISLGTPLGAEANMDSTVRKQQLIFTYEPSGEHENSNWNNHNGDDLIRMIQENDGWTPGWKPKLDKQGRMIMKRPFWNNFVEDQANEKIAQNFAYGMPDHQVIPEGAGKDVILDGTEKL